MARSPIRVGLYLRPQQHPLEVHRAVWRVADEASIDHLWSFDHLVAVGDDPTQPVFEGWTLLAAMASATTRVRIGLLVSGNLYRNPALLAKMAVTVDHISGGRLEMGIGAAWKEAEFRALGFDFPSTRERLERLDEACAVLKTLWREPRANFEGRYYRLREAIAEPKPLQQPHPPLWIGGSGPTRTLRTVARYADVWNSNLRSLAENVDRARVLDRHCAAEGRDPATIRRSVELPGDPARALADAAAYLRAGFTDFVLRLGGDDPRREAERLATDLVPRLRQLE